MIEELKKLADAATPGEWKVGEPDEFGDEAIVPVSGGLAVAVMVNGSFHEASGTMVEHDANAAFIAVSRSAIPALIERVERAEAENARMREALERLPGLTPVRANARTAGELHKSVKAIAETALSGGDIGPEQPWLERHIEERQS